MLEHPSVEAPTKPEASPLPLVESVTPSNSNSILVVEDNLLNQQITVHLLRSLGYEAFVVGTGFAALDAWEQGNFSLILLDCHLPGMNGYEIAREIRRRESNTRHIPIIALTATADVADRNLCIASGMDDYLSKPVKKADLEAAIVQHTSMLSSAVVAEAVKVVSKCPVLEIERWHELQSELDPELVRELVTLFLEETPQQLAELQEAVEKQHFEKIGQMAHKIKGSCVTLGVSQMAESCRKIESLLPRQDIEGIQVFLSDLPVQLEAVKAAIETEIAL
jgi:two-component system sensor histidine kinase/response regulator